MTALAIRPIAPKTVAIVAGVLIAAMATILFAMQHPLICTCGYVKLWYSGVNSAEESQHIADWYTWTHIIHGPLFYFGLWLIAGRWVPLSWRWVIATLGEVAWEILENSPIIIERYRAETVSNNYFGDSVINAVADVLAMLLGFFMAARLPVWVSIAVSLAIEALLLLVIRDNLALNVLMLVWPIAAIRNWQAGG